jgi:hypothetical protein
VFDVVEERVEPGASEDPDANLLPGSRGAQADFSFALEPAALFGEGSPEPECESEPEPECEEPEDPSFDPVPTFEPFESDEPDSLPEPASVFAGAFWPSLFAPSPESALAADLRESVA